MKVRSTSIFKLISLFFFCIYFAACSVQKHDPLPSWNEGTHKSSIMNFVENVSTEGSSDFVAAQERIAVFDNDGTLWAEKPFYFQLYFALDRIRELESLHPEWKSDPLFQAALARDTKAIFSHGEHGLFKLIMASHTGMSTEEFEEIVQNWIQSAKHPDTGLLFTEMVYKPMLELIQHLQSKDFKVFIVSGGGIEFMRPWTERVYGIPPEQVIGSSVKTKFVMQNDTPKLLRLPELNFLDDKEGKVIAINQHIGRRPILAFGNSDGDLQMLQWTESQSKPKLCAFVHHTDDSREWAYDRESSVGKLDNGFPEAQDKNWLLIDMKEDWKKVFASDKNK